MGVFTTAAIVGGAAKMGYDWYTEKAQREREDANTAKNRASVAKGQARIDTGRDLALSGAADRTRAAKEQLSRFDDSAAEKQKSIKYGAAKGFAAASDPDMAGGAAKLTGLAQAGLDSEMAGIRQKAADEEMRGSLTSAIGEAKQKEGELIGASGSKEETKAKAYADAVIALTKIDNSWSLPSTKRRERRATIEQTRTISKDAADDLMAVYAT